MSSISESRFRWVFWAALTVLVAGGGLWLWRATRSTPGSEYHFDTRKVTRGPVVAKVTASGTLSALVTVDVGSQVSGRIKNLYVDYNSEVKKGQVLAKLDPQLFQASLEQAKANYVAAKANLTKAQAEATQASRSYQRSKELAAKSFISPADLDTAQAGAESATAQVQAAQGQVAQTRAALHQAQINLQYTTIYSPIDGVVISRDVDVGQTVAASLQAPTLFVIAQDLSKMQVDTSVAEADVGKLRSGMEAAFTVDAYPHEKFKGRVRQIRNAPQTVQNVVTYDAVIDVDNPNLELRPGMTANVTFVYAKKADAVRVPNSALRFSPSPGMLKAFGIELPRQGRGRGGPNAARTVWVLKSGRPKPVQITAGLSDGMVTEVVGGPLEVGEDVIIDTMGGGGGAGGSMHGMHRLL